MSNVIKIGNDAAIPARFIAALAVRQEDSQLGGLWKVRAHLTDGPLQYYEAVFNTEAEARDALRSAAEQLEKYCAG